MTQNRILGEQLDIVDVSDDIANNPAAIDNIATGVVNDPAAIANLEAGINHDNIINGTGSPVVNSHIQIDSHIADGTLHFTQASISITASQVSDFAATTAIEIATASINDLSDVSVGSPATVGYVLTYSNSPAVWIAQPIGGISNPLTADLDTGGYAIRTADIPDLANGIDLVIHGGTNANTDTRNLSGDILITGSNATAAMTGGDVIITGGYGTSKSGGDANLTGGYSSGSTAGNVGLTGGRSAAPNLYGGNAFIAAGTANGAGSRGGNVTITAGAAITTGSPPTATGGVVEIFPGYGIDGTGTVDIHHAKTQTSTREGEGLLRIVRDNANALVGSVGLTVPATTTSHIVFTLPNTDGINGEVLTTDGVGNLTFAPASGSANNWLTANGGTNFSIPPSAGTIGKNNIALGSNAQASAGGGNRGVAIGANSYANHYATTSVGSYTQSGADYQINIGYGINGDATAYRATLGFGGWDVIGTPGQYQNLVTVYDQGKVEPIGDKAMFVAPKYTLATLPIVTEAGMIYVSDATASAGIGTQCFGRSSGSPLTLEWIDVTTSIAVV